MFMKWGGGHGLDWSGSGQGQVAGTCKCSNEPSDAVKYGEFRGQLRAGQHFGKDSAVWNNQCEECTEHVGEIGNAYKVLIEYLKGRAFGRPIYGWFGWYVGNSMSKLQIQVATYVF